MSRSKSLNKIREILSIFSEKIRIGTENQELDDNIHAENIFTNVLNMVYGWNLINMNYVDSNFPCIDLADEKRKIAVQVTATCTVTKINKTLKCFFRNNLDNKYDTLYFYFIRDFNRIDQSRIQDNIERGFNFDVNKHLLSKEKIYLEINRINESKKIKKLEALLEDELGTIVDSTPLPRIGLSFADQDFGFVKSLINELTELKVIIYTNSTHVKENLQQYNTSYVIPIERSVPKDMDYLMAINTINFKIYKNNHVNKCNLLQTAIKRHLSIFPYKPIIEEQDSIEINDLKSYDKLIETENYSLEQLPILAKTFVSKIRNFEFTKIKGYSDITLALEYFEGGGFILQAKENIPSDKIAYELYFRKNSWGVNQYVLYLYDSINQIQTVRDIEDRYPNALRDNNLIILTPKPKLIEPDTRKINIADKFEIDEDRVFFIADFIWEKCTHKEQKQLNSKYSLETFVPPYIQDENDAIYDFEKYIDSWLVSDYNPILVLKGKGGMGKTTLAKSITNYCYKKFPKANVLFINSQQIVDKLINISQQNESIDLYKMYIANHNTEKNEIYLNQELFRLNIDNGNILLIIDGLDEIISKLSSYFDINLFFESIFDYTKEIGNGKVLITCRNHFWNKSNPIEDRFESLEILPFDEPKAKDFFGKHYPQSPNLVDKGLSIAKKLLGSSKNEYIPFVLDQVKVILEETLENGIFEDPLFDSSILNQEIENDYVIYQICNRETIRVKQVPVDQQIKNFIDFAVFNKIDLDGPRLDLFKAHPIINSAHNQPVFKYDFFKSYFKNMYVGELLKSDLPININLINILADDIGYNSSSTNELCSRIPNLDEDYKFRICEIINTIATFEGINEKLKRKAISGLFLISLKKLHEGSHSNKEYNTNLLEELFMDGNILRNFSLINVTSSDNQKIIFDFRGLHFEDCYFSNYDFFWECEFDENTKFRGCYFYELQNHNKIKTKANDINFDSFSCTFDETVLSTLRGAKQTETNITNRMRNDLINYLKIFSKSGFRLIRIPLEKLKSRYRQEAIDFKKIHKIMMKHNVVKEYNSPSNVLSVEVNKDYKNDILKFLHDGTNTKVIKNIIIDIKNHLK